MKTIIYVSAPGNNQIQVLKVNQNFNLKIIQTLDVDGEVQPIFISENCLYAGIRPKFQVITFNIKHDGTLEKIGESPIPGSPNYLSVDKKKRFLFCASYGKGCLSVSPINKLGVPQEPIQIFNNIEGCHYCNTDFENKILFATSLKKNCIYLYDLTCDNLPLYRKSYVLNTYPGSGPRHIDFHPKKKYIYSINELNGTIDVWKLREHEKPIKFIQNISLLQRKNNYTPWASDIHVHPSGSYLYACDRASSLLLIFKINKNSNKLKKIGSLPTEKQPRSFSISSNGQYLVVAGEISNSITLYEILNNSFYLQEREKISVAKRPIWIHIHQF